MAHDCAILGIHIDSWRLYSGFDHHYELWLETLTDMVNNTHREHAERQRRESKK
jgi:hypothetical protein